jgi:hypothetical protein
MATLALPLSPQTARIAVHHPQPQFLPTYEEVFGGSSDEEESSGDEDLVSYLDIHGQSTSGSQLPSFPSNTAYDSQEHQAYAESCLAAVYSPPRQWLTGKRSAPPAPARPRRRRSGTTTTTTATATAARSSSSPPKRTHEDEEEARLPVTYTPPNHRRTARIAVNAPKRKARTMSLPERGPALRLDFNINAAQADRAEADWHKRRRLSAAVAH